VAGVNVGWEVGNVMGAKVGRDVGSLEGELVGKLVGLVVGFVEGASTSSISSTLLKLAFLNAPSRLELMTISLNSSTKESSFIPLSTNTSRFVM
jgi:hypothetical protein